ncbi:MAG: hypothetical protein AAGI89_02020 [Pseudomonadota bacterium]
MSCLTAACAAEDEHASRHPVIGEINARELTGADVLALPDRERDAFIHGGVTMMIQTAAVRQVGTSQCLLAWYWDTPDAHTSILEFLERQPDTRAAAIIFGIADHACESLNP